MKLNVRQSIVYIAFILGLVLAVLIIGSVIAIFDDPNSKTSRTISGFETYLGAVIAFSAALLTVVVIYVSAKLQVDADHRRHIEQQIRLEKAGAAVLLAQIRAMGTALDVARQFYVTYLNSEQKDRREIPIPILFADYSVISSQSIEVATVISDIISKVMYLNEIARIGTISNTSDERDENLRLIDEVLSEARDDCLEARRLLTAIIEN